jgi:hypothetical protein
VEKGSSKLWATSVIFKEPSGQKFSESGHPDSELPFLPFRCFGGVQCDQTGRHFRHLRKHLSQTYLKVESILRLPFCQLFNNFLKTLILK